MKTSNFSKASRAPGAVSIALGAPAWYQGIAYPTLAPPGELLGWFRREKDQPEADIPELIREFEYRYRTQVLRLLRPKLVWVEIHDLVRNTSAPDGEPILLCWCGRGKFCHRRVVADWLHEKLGVDVPELVESDPPSYDGLELFY